MKAWEITGSVSLVSMIIALILTAVLVNKTNNLPEEGSASYNKCCSSKSSQASCADCVKLSTGWIVAGIFNGICWLVFVITLIVSMVQLSQGK